MSTLTRYINPFIQYTDANGVPMKGGFLYTYISGTSTPLNTYSDSALTTPNTNPIVLDAAGYIPGAVFLTTGTYKYVLTDSAGGNIRTSDPNAGAAATGGTLPVLSGNAGDFGKTIEVTADGSNYQLTTTLNAAYTIASALATTGPVLTLKDEGAASVATAHPYIQYGESAVVGGTQTNMGIVGYSETITNPVVFTGVGLNDATSGGTETSGRPHQYTVIIDTTGTPDKFKWQVDGGAFTTAVSITGAAQTLTNGVTIRFAATTGHTLNDQWVFQTGESLNIINSISGGNINLNTTGVGKVYINGALTPALPTANVIVLAATGTFTTPADVTANTVFKITMVAPGGGGAGSASGGAAGGGGGSGGTAVLYKSGTSPSTGYNYTQGAIGTGGASGANNGTAGGTSTFGIAGTTITCTGGGAGLAAGNGGAGGTATNGTWNITGGDGGAGTTGNINVGTGSGGVSFFGGGGAPKTATAASAGSAYGSGGGGAYNNGGLAGGSGGTGLLIIERLSG